MADRLYLFLIMGAGPMSLSHGSSKIIIHIADGRVGNVYAVGMVAVVCFHLYGFAVTSPAPAVLIVKIIAHKLSSLILGSSAALMMNVYVSCIHSNCTECIRIKRLRLCGRKLRNWLWMNLYSSRSCSASSFCAVPSAARRCSRASFASTRK